MHLRTRWVYAAGAAAALGFSGVFAFAGCSNKVVTVPAAPAPQGDSDAGDTDAGPPVHWTNGSGGKLGASMQTLASKGVTHNFAVHTPPGYDGSQGVPLVLHFHGWRPLPAGVDDEVKYVWAPTADKNNFIAVAPEGLECPELNPGGPAYACFEEERDGTFLDDLLKFLGANYNLDLDRLYLSGHSGGGFFTQGYALDNPKRFAAAAIFEGGCISQDDSYGNSCAVYQKVMKTPERKIPFYDIHYPKDQVVQVAMGTAFMSLLKQNAYPYSTLPNYDHHNGGSTGHSIDPTEVPGVWAYLSKFSLAPAADAPATGN
jgi:poly(3-hydroxybutyrate) depolymerase